MSGNVNVKYQRLTQIVPSDEEDVNYEDNILFDSRLVHTPTDHSRNVFELERVGLPRRRTSKGSLCRNSVCNFKTICGLMIILVCLTTITLTAVLYPILLNTGSSGTVTSFKLSPSTEDWDQSFSNMWTESSIHIHDVDKDGLDDIVIGLAEQNFIEAALSRSANITMKQFCALKGFEYPCGGMVKSFRGHDGFQIWSSHTRSVVIYQNCADIDVNGDGLSDCIVTGRHSTCQAVDVTNGELLWIVDPDASLWSSHLVPDWNVYQALTLPDLDDDGVMDLLVTHGGDKAKEPWDHDRRAGRLILLSGKTGHPIGKNFVEVPGSKETYMPPIKYVTEDGTIYVLVGSGGETVPGGLYATSLVDIYLKATGSSSIPTVLKHSNSGSDDGLQVREKDENGFISLFSDGESGVMVPPVLVDHDNDGHVDLLVSTFNGQVALLAGPSLETRWLRTFQGMQSYSSPSPGLFNDDMVLDFMVHLNEGVWDIYNGSQTLILDGTDGATLWSVDAESYFYSSDLSLRIADGKSDVFLLKLVGLNSNVSQVMSETLQKRHLGHPEGDAGFKSTADMNAEEFKVMCDQVMSEMASDHPVCGSDLRLLSQEILLLSRWMPDSPLKVFEQKAEEYHYQLDHNRGELHCHPLSQRQKDKIDMCSVLIPTSYTGAVTDVDGDDSLDYLHITQMIGTQRSDTLSHTNFISNIILSKRSLQKAIDRKEAVHLDAERQDDSMSPSVSNHLESLKFQSKSCQTWTQYLGTMGHSYFHVPEC